METKELVEIKIGAVLRGTIQRDDDAGVFVSYCPALDIYSQGETEQEAIEAITGAVALFDRGVKRTAIRARLSTPAAEANHATRPETGPMRFGGDWTGVFIRGDDAFAYANYIDQLLKVTIATDFMDTVARMNVESLARILLRAVERHETPKAQALRPFAECLSTIDSLAGVGT